MSSPARGGDSVAPGTAFWGDTNISDAGNAGSLTSSHAPSLAFNWLPHFLSQRVLTSSVPKEREYNALTVGGNALFATSNSTALQPSPRHSQAQTTHFLPNAALEARQAMHAWTTGPSVRVGQRDVEVNGFTISGHGYGEPHPPGGDVTPQQRVIGDGGGGAGLYASVDPHWGLFRPNAIIMDDILRRRPSLWRFMRDSHARVRHAPQTFSRSWMQRINCRNRAIQGFLKRHYQATHPQWAPLSLFNPLTFEPPQDAHIGFPRYPRMLLRALGRERYAKRPPRPLSFVKSASRCHLREKPQLEYVPFIIKGWGGGTRQDAKEGTLPFFHIP
ncbi:hypothetical protein TraAM80_01669 [Trypanosoma rangeli]|uniref:Uncharacterized protein n=1 Tax=Trypanosoma rangeli TaxID=5698 RepID=A0A422NXL9_TRYRA|nr:uncharacterized protein TraAM80_01669 [Trypanosoma rangeli]RNF10230.1 hypothetical protein TraAM80_01669 [Trypanosoma rangeli]|eukprot:RNF10230.1 hypothetical protein TraAM80_01669 [Trypanosoma rangeli]